MGTRTSKHFTKMTNESASVNVDDEFEIIKHPTEEIFMSSHLEKYASTLIEYNKGEDYEKMVQRSKRDLFIKYMQTFGKIPNYDIRKGSCFYTFETRKLGNNYYFNDKLNIVLPSEKFPFGALFKSYGKAGFAAILEDGTYYISCIRNNEGTRRREFFTDCIVLLQWAAEEAQKMCKNNSCSNKFI